MYGDWWRCSTAERVWTTFLGEWLAWSQGHVVSTVEATRPDLLRTRPALTAPSIAFHAWHLARWADRHQAQLPIWLARATTPRPEIWVRDAVATRWGFDAVAMGEYGIGAGLDDEASAALPLPDIGELMAYARPSFAAFVDVVLAIESDSILTRTVTDLYGDRSTIGDVIAGVISHTDRHLGMMEAIRGVLGQEGTATV